MKTVERLIFDIIYYQTNNPINIFFYKLTNVNNNLINLIKCPFVVQSIIAGVSSLLSYIVVIFQDSCLSYCNFLVT